MARFFLIIVLLRLPRTAVGMVVVGRTRMGLLTPFVSNVSPSLCRSGPVGNKKDPSSPSSSASSSSSSSIFEGPRRGVCVWILVFLPIQVASASFSVLSSDVDGMASSNPRPCPSSSTMSVVFFFLSFPFFIWTGMVCSPSSPLPAPCFTAAWESAVVRLLARDSREVSHESKDESNSTGEMDEAADEDVASRPGLDPDDGNRGGRSGSGGEADDDAALESSAVVVGRILIIIDISPSPPLVQPPFPTPMTGVSEERTDSVMNVEVEWRRDPASPSSMVVAASLVPSWTVSGVVRASFSRREEDLSLAVAFFSSSGAPFPFCFPSCGFSSPDFFDIFAGVRVGRCKVLGSNVPLVSVVVCFTGVTRGFVRELPVSPPRFSAMPFPPLLLPVRLPVAPGCRETLGGSLIAFSVVLSSSFCVFFFSFNFFSS